MASRFRCQHAMQAACLPSARITFGGVFEFGGRMVHSILLEIFFSAGFRSRLSGFLLM